MARLPIAFVIALLFTGSLFAFLHALTQAALDLEDLRPAAKIEFSRLRRDTEVQSRRQEKAVRERPAAAPNMPQISRVSFGGAPEPVQILAPMVDTRGAMTNLSVSVEGSDRDVIPLVRIDPEYPMRAQSHGIEGWVLIQFTVTTTGTVKDVSVVDSEPKNVFDDAAIKAVSRWKYSPKIQEGVAVERVGLQVILSFKMEEP
ncbi:MAG: energy transducer TonB [bacterium]